MNLNIIFTLGILCLFNINCNESILQIFNQFKNNVAYKTNNVEEHLSTLATYHKKSLALQFIEEASTNIDFQVIKQRAQITAQHVFVAMIYPCINHCFELGYGLWQDKICSSIFDNTCPHFFHIHNKLQWEIARSQSEFFRTFMIVSIACFSAYKYKKRIQSLNRYYRASHFVLKNIHANIESLSEEHPIDILPYYYQPLLMYEMQIHHYNFNKLWDNSTRKTIKDIAYYEKALAQECVDLIKNNLKQDKRKHVYRCLGLSCFLMSLTYTQAIHSMLNGADEYIIDQHIQNGHTYILYGMLPFMPLLLYLLSYETSQSINDKLKVLERFEDTL